MCKRHTAIQDYEIMERAAAQHGLLYDCTPQMCGRSMILIAFHGDYYEVNMNSFIENYCGGLVYEKDRYFLTVHYPEVH